MVIEIKRTWTGRFAKCYFDEWPKEPHSIDALDIATAIVFRITILDDTPRTYYDIYFGVVRQWIKWRHKQTSLKLELTSCIYSCLTMLCIMNTLVTPFVAVSKVLLKWNTSCRPSRRRLRNISNSSQKRPGEQSEVAYLCKNCLFGRTTSRCNAAGDAV